MGLGELADACGPAAAPLLGGDGTIANPLLAVDLDAPGPPAQAAQITQAARAARRSDRILAGVTSRPAHPLAEALDLTLTSAVTADRALVTCDPRAVLGQIQGTASANPQAAIILAGLLRWSGALPVRDALEAESLAYSTLLGGPEFGRWLRARGPRPLPPPAAAPVLVERDSSTLTITLNRPERRNAYGREVRDALVGALDLARRSGLGVVLAGNGPAFCSGGDLDEFGTAPDLVTAHLVRTSAGAARLLHDLRDRTEARLHGACVGAGVELPAFAGRVTAAGETVFRLPEVGMGLIPGAGGTVSLPRRIGRWRTLYLALTGGWLDLGTARQWGLVD
jgi:hypothetical protein